MTKIEEFENRVIQTGITVEDLKIAINDSLDKNNIKSKIGFAV